LSDTPANRALIENTANNKANYLGTDKYGTDWYAKTQADGTQVWVECRNGTITNGGLNASPKPFNPETGLKTKAKSGN
jgi:filamentous hemagglutinin